MGRWITAVFVENQECKEEGGPCQRNPLQGSLYQKGVECAKNLLSVEESCFEIKHDSATLEPQFNPKLKFKIHSPSATSLHRHNQLITLKIHTFIPKFQHLVPLIITFKKKWWKILSHIRHHQGKLRLPHQRREMNSPNRQLKTSSPAVMQVSKNHRRLYFPSKTWFGMILSQNPVRQHSYLIRGIQESRRSPQSSWWRGVRFWRQKRTLYKGQHKRCPLDLLRKARFWIQKDHNKNQETREWWSAAKNLKAIPRNR